jgi:hypothetical protein
MDENLRLWNATNGESDETSEQQDPAEGWCKGAHQGEVEEQDGAQGERLLAAVLVAQHAPKRRAQHHPQEHHLGNTKRIKFNMKVKLRRAVAFSHTLGKFSPRQILCN